MKHFRFRLESVLRLREQAEEAARERCAKANGAVESAAARLRAAEAAIAASDETRRDVLGRGVRVDEIEKLRLHGVLLRERRLVAARELEDRKREAEVARRELLQATQQRETLDKLRDRQRHVYAYEAARAEQKLLDELAGRRPAPAAAWRNLETVL
jgi:flagellar FliJ protein